jgi:branched-chain amino acid aminotransferase
MSAVVSTARPVSTTWTFFEGEWREGNIAIMGPRTHGAWLGSTVFDGARAFEGVTPDLGAHCARVNRSAENFLLQPVVPVETWIGLAREGVKRFGAAAELYIRPMYWADQGYGGGVMFDPETTRWCLSIYEAPMPAPTGSAITLSPFRRPTIETAPVDAKASCLYPNNARALFEARRRGFDNCIQRDMLGAVAELANANIFMVKDGVVFTPAPNGVFLDGITRRRVISLLREDGVEVREETLGYEAFLAADEIFSSGNYAKVAPMIAIEGRKLPIGPMFLRARALYWAFAHGAAAKPARMLAPTPRAGPARPSAAARI